MSATAGDAAASPAGSGSFPRLDAQFAQLAVDSRSAPERILGGDLHHECTNGHVRTWAARTGPR
jgi:hypothetical protein